MNDRKVRVGIIGCGNIFTMHSTSLMNTKDVVIAGVCDIRKERADKAAAECGCPAYYDYKQLIDKSLIDSVHICLPHYLHAPVSKYALERGIHVLCEKPMSINLEDAHENIRIAKQNNLTYGVIFQCRFNDSSRLVKENLVNGKLGKIISARSVLTWYRPDSYYSQSDWKGTWDKEGGGVIIDQAIHSLDLVNWFIDDEPVKIQAQLTNRNHKIMDVDDTGEGFIRYKNGATYAFYAMNNYGYDEPIEIRLYCEKGKVVMDYDKAEIFFNDGEYLCAEQKSDGVDYKDAKDYWGFQHLKQIRDFYKSLAEGKNPHITASDALKIQEIVCGIYKKGNFIKHD